MCFVVHYVDWPVRFVDFRRQNQINLEVKFTIELL